MMLENSKFFQLPKFENIQFFTKSIGKFHNQNLTVSDFRRTIYTAQINLEKENFLEKPNRPFQQLISSIQHEREKKNLLQQI